MMKSGVKRKASLRRKAANMMMTSTPAGAKKAMLTRFEAEEEDYATNLTNFQIAARRRESLRIKNQVNMNSAQSLEKALKDKISVEMSLTEGTAKFILASTKAKANYYSGQVLEAAKTLHVSRLRTDMLKFELNKLRRGRGSPTAQRVSYASLSLSDVRIPLAWANNHKVQ